MPDIFRRAEDRHNEQRMALMAMINNSSGLFNPAQNTVHTAILRDEPTDRAVRVEYVPVENGYVVNISKARNEAQRIYVAKDLAEAHELVTTFMVKERLK